MMSGGLGLTSAWYKLIFQKNIYIHAVEVYDNNYTKKKGQPAQYTPNSQDTEPGLRHGTFGWAPNIKLVRKLGRKSNH